ncbi:MAG: ArsC/Spx/MgsR family protein [Bacteroidota bacterium]|nr:ArsC/Spx/MgsR family protein [Bacteroidota bacterium]
MKKVYHLSTCDTCSRILKQLKLKEKGFELQDIKTEGITKPQLEEMYELAGSYEALFSRVALKYKALAAKPTKENEYKKLILQEYTFLRRPVIISGKSIFIGNKKGTIEEAQKALS